MPDTPTTIRLGTRQTALTWRNTQLLPEGARHLLDAFARLTPAGEDAVDALGVEVSHHRLPRDHTGLGTRRPATGPLAEVPSHPLITMDDWDGLLLWGWRDAGLLAGEHGTGRADLHPGHDADATAWMTSQLTGTVLHLIGSVRALHATAVRWEGRTLLLVGGSGSGKTTLTLLLLLAGARVLAEDFVYLTGDGRLLGASIRRHLTMRRGTWQALAPELRRWWGPQPQWDERPTSAAEAFRRHREGQVRLPIDPVEVRDPGAAPARLDAVLLPRVDPDGKGFEVTPCAPEEVAEAARSGVDERMLRWPTPFLTPGAERVPAEIAVTAPAARLDFGLDYPEHLPALHTALRTHLATAVPPTGR